MKSDRFGTLSQRDAHDMIQILTERKYREFGPSCQSQELHQIRVLMLSVMVSGTILSGAGILHLSLIRL